MTSWTIRVGTTLWPAAGWPTQSSSSLRGRTELFCFTFLKAFPGQCWFGRSVHLGCWDAASHLVLKLEWVGSCQRLDWEIWMQAGNPSDSSSQIGTVGKTLENHNYFKQNTKFVSFLNIMEIRLDFWFTEAQRSITCGTSVNVLVP